MAGTPDPLQEDKSRNEAASEAHTYPEIPAGPGTRPGADKNRRTTWWFFATTRRDPQSAENDRFWDDQGLLWTGFSFAAGIAVYAGLPEEPFWPLLLLVAAAAGTFAIRVGRVRSISRVFLLVLAFLAGATTGALRTALVEAPRIAEPMNVDLTGQVLDRQVTGTGVRLLLRVLTVNNQSAAEHTFPNKVRIRVTRETTAVVGDTVQLSARLFPPTGPVAPGGYDFAFRAYFTQIGATGFSFGPAVTIDGGGIPLSLRASAKVQNIRDEIAARIRASLGVGPETALSVALLVGDRSGIEEQQEADLRAAGLAHILAISGLHMALFAGGTYGIVVLLLAFFPGLPLRWPTHKWAAMAALVAACVYLLLSGASVATQRSFLMISLVFLGIFVGRRGLTLRSVALAGLVLLLLAPERLFFPGFQMSFAAVICLVAVYELWRRREQSFGRKHRGQTGFAARLLGATLRWSAGLFVTALVAGLATGIIGAHHFGRIAPFGLVGNLLGMPVFSLVVMPMGVLALVLMPFGLSALPLALMSLGISWLLDIAAFTAEMGADAGAVGRLGAVGALLFISALFAGLLLPGRWRLSALLPLMTGVALIGADRQPDIQLAASGSRLAARDDHGDLKWSGGRNSFVSEVWLANEGVSAGAIKSRKMKSPQRKCDSEGCVVLGYPNDQETGFSPANLEPLAIGLPKSAEALEMDCRFADIIVTDLVVPKTCSTELVIDRTVRLRRGAASVWISVDEPEFYDGATSTEKERRDEISGRTKIKRILYAIPDPPRPWHSPGTVTRASLRQAKKQK